MIDIFFNRPDRALPIDELIQDIEACTERLVLASAWFTDESIAQAIIDCRAACKLVFLNNGDKKRGDRKAVQRLYHALQPYQIIVLGSESFEEGIMHHKWCLIDSQTVWVGSYNFTSAARRNFETLLRIQDATIANQFWEETEVLMTYQSHAFGDDGAPDVCIRCGQLVGIEYQIFEYDGVVCKTCDERFYGEF